MNSPIAPNQETNSLTQPNVYRPNSQVITNAAVGGNTASNLFSSVYGENATVVAGNLTFAEQGRLGGQVANIVGAEEIIPISDTPGELTKGLRYSPLQLDILTGKYANKKFDLGTNIVELETSQTAEWTDLNDHGIRPGAQFQKISHREITISLDYYLPNQDVSPLVENWAHLHELTSDATAGNTANRQPPLLIITVGFQRYRNAVMTSFNARYDTPLPEKAGLRHCVVNISFIAFGGLGSPYQTAPPFAITPLTIDVGAETINETQARQVETVVTRGLADCIGDETATVNQIIRDGRASDPNAWLSLQSPDAFINVLVAGFADSVVGSGEIQARLRQDLARQVAAKYASPSEALILERSLINDVITPPATTLGNLTTLLPDGRTVYEALKTDYDQIYQSIINKSVTGDIMTNSSRASAQEMLTDAIKGVAVCGVRLLNQKVNVTDNASGVDINSLKMINTAIAQNDDATLIDIFAIPTTGRTAILNAIKRGSSYESKQEFQQFVNENTSPAFGLTAWNNFLSWQNQQLTDINNFIATEDNTAIADRFNVDSTVANDIKNNGNSYNNLPKFYQKVGGVETGIPLILNFYKNN